MHRHFSTTAAVFLASTALALADAESDARSILAQSGVKGGFVVHVGSGDGSLTAALKANESYQVHGLDADAEKVAAAREAILKAGGYGPVSVDAWNGKDLPYIEGTREPAGGRTTGQVAPGGDRARARAARRGAW